MLEKRVRIKICGITRLEDALLAAQLGVDAIGFVFYEQSPRFITPVEAAIIARQLSPFVSIVGLLVNASQNDVNNVLLHCLVDVLQFHGDESPEFCALQQRRIIKAIPVREQADLARAHDYSCPILLDAKAKLGVYGGTGAAFDWTLLNGFEHKYPLMLAGGLNTDNVGRAMAIRPWEVLDISSGVESAPGIKDAEKMRHLMRIIRQRIQG